MNNDNGSMAASLFFVAVVVSCMLVLTDAAEMVFAIWTVILLGAIGLYVILIPIKILMIGLEALSDAFSGRR